MAAAGTTAAAASTLHLSQPAVSRALLAAEDRLGTRLFERSPRGCRRRRRASRWWPERRGCSPSWWRSSGACERLRSGRRACAWCASATRPITGCRRRSPSWPRTRPASSSRWRSSTARAGGGADRRDHRRRAADHGGGAAGEIATQPLFSDEIVFVVAPTHALARKPTLSRDDLRAARLITGETPEAETRWFLRRVFGRGRLPGRAQRLPLTEAILDVARAGMGVAVLSEWMAGPHLGRGDLVVKRLSSGPLRRPWRMAWRREAEEAARCLLAALKAAAPSLRGGERA
ncbi:LysR family transcriptional regulator [Nannocystis pusilla]|uniref:LysR family transcriptional regulator n=1 Tax=Nannocystis pusilla TaxID=889268 RepID=UPI003B7A34B9